MRNPKKIFIAGHAGMVGSAICRKLEAKNDIEILVASKSELNLLDQYCVKKFFEKHRPDQVYLSAAKVGGIYANNTFPAEFIYENIMIQTNVIHSAFQMGVKKLLFLGSSCIYPVLAKQPMKEYELLNGKLEATNEPYAIAKIAGIKLCESYNRQYSESHDIDYRCIMPTNLYGPGDRYDLLSSHVIPAMILKFHNAKINNIKSVELWGTGKAFREFLFVDDLADACYFVMNLQKSLYLENTSPQLSHINVGSNSEISIFELALMIKKVVQFKGDISFNSNVPDGAPRKLMDSSIINSLGWHSKTSLEEGLTITYKNFLNDQSS